MLYRLTMPNAIKHALANASTTQLLLFEWAAKTTDPTLADCASWLAKSSRLGEKAGALCKWLSNSEKRQETLLAFAQHPEKIEKVAWFRRNADEQERFGRDESTGTLKPLSADSSTSREWEKAGKALLIRFYDEFRSNSGLPAVVTRTKKSFSSQDYLRLLQDANDDLILCSFCQEHAYATIGLDKDGDSRFAYFYGGCDESPQSFV